MIHQVNMSLSIQSTPDSFKRLSSDQNMVSSKNLQDLPLEILGIIATFLKGADLENLSHVSSKFKSATLIEKNVQQMHLAKNKLQVLANLRPPAAKIGSCCISLYQAFLDDLRDDNMLDEYPELAIHPKAFEKLKLALLELSTKQVADEFLALSHDCYKQIHANKASFTLIKEKYRIKKACIVAQALDHVINATVDPKLARGFAIKEAAITGHLEIIQELLAKGPISDEDRTEAFQEAAEHGYLKIVQALLVDHELFSENFHGIAVWKAAKQGQQGDVENLLKNGSISDSFRGWIVKDVVREGCIEVLKVLLASGNIPCDHRGMAICLAAKQGSLEKVQTLLKSGLTYKSYKDQAMMDAARKGYLSVVKALLEHEMSSEEERGRAVINAAEKGHGVILQVLLDNGVIDGDFRGQAVIEAAKKGRLEIVQQLLSNGPVSDFYKQQACQDALSQVRSQIEALLMH